MSFSDRMRSITPNRSARLAPNLIVAEPTELIGTGQTSSMDYVRDSIARIKAINPAIMVLQGAGISNGQDVYNVIRAGAEATGATSGILKAPDPAAMAREMIAAVRRAWAYQSERASRSLPFSVASFARCTVRKTSAIAFCSGRGGSGTSSLFNDDQDVLGWLTPEVVFMA